MNKKQVGISVVIPTRNEEKYLGRLLNSINRQTYTNFEVLVCDFNSSDKTREIAKEKGARVIGVRKRGQSHARNVGIKNAKGDIIAFIDADFVLSKGLFEDSVKKMREGVAAAVPKFSLDTAGVPLSKQGFYSFCLKVDNLWKKISLSTYNPRAYGCVFCSAKEVHNAGFFKENLLVSEDPDFYNRLRREGRFILLRKSAKLSFRRILKRGLLLSGYLYLKSDLKYYFKAKRTSAMPEVR
ncbi:glycosyltransferase family 2 protein [Candidatus Parvarchaeota archaeon]|jgi:glycosyltransferase involved in cell wall biosynthesis|nr:glycosyltransferase family 2 protein [Candidatus Parvarchaeota archaeon]